jgi:hypothetical protein
MSGSSRIDSGRGRPPHGSASAAPHPEPGSSIPYQRGPTTGMPCGGRGLCREQIRYMRSSIAVLGRPTHLTRNSGFGGTSCPRGPGRGRAFATRPSLVMNCSASDSGGRAMRSIRNPLRRPHAERGLEQALGGRGRPAMPRMSRSSEPRVQPLVAGTHSVTSLRFGASN